MSAASFKRIDVFMTVTSQYQVLHHFSQKLFEALKRTGIECRLLTVDKLVESLTKDPPELTIAFNAFPEVEGNLLLCDALKIPHLAILVDPPHWGGVYATKSPFIIMGCDDLYGCTFLNNLNFTRTLFIPHAVEIDLLPDPFIEKIYDVVLLGSFYDYESEKASWPNSFPKPIAKLMEETAKMAFDDPNDSFIHVFVSSFYNVVRENSMENLSSEIFLEALQSLERYIKGKDRSLLIKALKDVPLHLFGNSVAEKNTWETYLGNDNPNIHIHEAVDYQEAIAIMKRTKILLNPQLKNRQGAHERFFTGTACGALVISSDSDYLREQFVENEEIILYQHSHLPDINPIIKHYLENDRDRNIIVEKTRAKVMKNHTWDARIKAFLPQLEEICKEI